MEEINWNLASNSQLKEECERLENEFNKKQELITKALDEIEKLNEEMTEMSKKYIEVKNILNTREGKMTSI